QFQRRDHDEAIFGVRQSATIYRLRPMSFAAASGHIPAFGLAQDMVREASPETVEARRRIAAALATEGFDAKAVCVKGSKIPTVYTVAHEIEGWGYRLSYRLIDPNWLMIGMYERLDPKCSMRDAFTLMRWFVEFLRRRDLGIEYVLGRVDTVAFRGQGDLDDSRLLKYYVRWGGARAVSREELTMISERSRKEAAAEGIDYVKIDVADFKLKRQRHQPSIERQLAE
ncbi:MAG: hypothetical protein AAFY56_15580, partial [Pseudomonadota bacterium]